MSSPPNRTPLALKIIAAILTIAALTVGREFFIPIALALCFHALLRPVVRALEGVHLKPVFGATIVVLGALALFVVGGMALSGPVGNFVSKAPASIAAAREKVRKIARPFDRMTDAAAGKADAPGATTAPPPPPGPPPQAAPGPQPPVPTLLSELLGRGTLFVAGLVEVLVLLYLMLAAGNMLFRKLVKVVPGPDEKRTVSDVLHETESIVARYLLVTALINVGLLLIIGFTVFPDIGHVLLAPAIYLVITTIQNNVVSPYAYGGRLKLNPLAVMICVMFWWFIWGIPGVFLSIPIAATLKVLGDQVPRMSALAELLGE